MNESQSGRWRPDGLRDLSVSRGPAVRFSFDGEAVDAHAGESVAAALLAVNRRILRDSPREGAPRGAFCWMGLCQECTVVADGRRQPACRLACREGLVVVSGTPR